MTAKEINQLAPAEIDVKLRETREALLQNRLRRHTGQVTKTHQIRADRKTIARLLTAANSKKRASKTA